MEIRPGKRSDQFMTLKETLEGPKQGTRQLPFQIECRDLQQKLIRPEGGLGAENTIDWLSYITIVDQGARQDMLVHLNNVGNYRGYRFFQSQFLPIGNARKITVSFEPVNGSGSPIIVRDIPRNGSVDVPEIGNVRYVEFYAEVEKQGSEYTTVDREYKKPAAALEITRPDGQKKEVVALGPEAASEMLGQGAGKSSAGDKSDFIIDGRKALLKDFEKVSFTHTLTIQYDPGRTPVYIGFTLLVFALCWVFFFSHQRVWAVIEPGAGGSRVYFGGNTNRNRPAFEARFNSLVQTVTEGGGKDE